MAEITHTDNKGKFELPEYDELTYRPVLPKSELQHGHYYVGRCRNASVARWNANQQCFYHWRKKFDRIYIQKIKHPVDEPEFDVFRVLKELAEPKFEIPLRKNAKFVGNPEDLFQHNAYTWCSCEGQGLCAIHFGRTPGSTASRS